VDKKNWIIIAMSVVICILVFINITGDREFETIIDTLSGQRDDAFRSAAIIKSELDRSIGENTQLEADNIRLENDNTELERIVDDLTTGSKKTDEHLTEYGNINSDFEEFIRQANEAD
jgi:hypothetical protein